MQGKRAYMKHIPSLDTQRVVPLGHRGPGVRGAWIHIHRLSGDSSFAAVLKLAGCGADLGFLPKNIAFSSSEVCNLLSPLLPLMLEVTYEVNIGFISSDSSPALPAPSPAKSRAPIAALRTSEIWPQPLVSRTRTLACTIPSTVTSGHLLTGGGLKHPKPR